MTSTSMYALPLRKFSHCVHDVLFYFKDCTLESDVMCVTNKPKCKFKEYEMKKLKWLKHQLSEATSLFHEGKETLVQHEVASETEFIGIINNIQEVIDDISMTSSTLNANTLWVNKKKRLLTFVMMELLSLKVWICHNYATTFFKQQMLVQVLVSLTSKLSTETLRCWVLMAGLI